MDFLVPEALMVKALMVKVRTVKVRTVLAVMGEANTGATTERAVMVLAVHLPSMMNNCLPWIRSCWVT
jgi:hypothetical protein